MFFESRLMYEVYDFLMSRTTLITEKIMAVGSSEILSFLCCFRYKFSNLIRLQVNIDTFFQDFSWLFAYLWYSSFSINFLHLLICNLVSHVLCSKTMSFHKCLECGNRRRMEFHATKRLNTLDSGYGKWVSQLFRDNSLVFTQ